MQVVFGANGRAGGEIARALLERGEAVRVVLRQPEHRERWIARGADVAMVDIVDADAVAAALKGALGAFLLNPTPRSGDPYAHAQEVGTALAHALHAAQLPKAVVLSSIGAQHASGTGVIATLNQIEMLLEGTAPAITFLRSAYFVETWSEVAGTAVTEGVLPTFLEVTQKIPMVSTIDVGRTGAALLCENWTGKRIVELSGPEDWSASDVAMVFAKLLGHPVEPIFVPSEERSAILTKDGIDNKAAEGLLAMYEGIANGRFVREDGNEQRRGVVSLTAAVERILSPSRTFTVRT
ncbi:NmrA family NAD(P)-binding protein [Hyphomicrobium sp.]|uniref:NmrA family NAD(P)-binding protein n=1 Tax=Hyphomicrobium sp. TaxID=82 RepID=UPI0025C6B4E8|nr:NmrA family NAD(P)-binding protein [Hyphomicrobium sp.]MCC7252489.1 NAD(P)H-binding protein [Hyphomicrobium sp.]